MRICVDCTVFAYVCVRLLRVKRLVRTYTDFARWSACVYRYRSCALSILCARIHLLRVKRLVRMDTLIDSFNVSVILSWVFADLFDVPMIRSWVLLICLTFVWPLMTIGPPGRSVRRIRYSGFFCRKYATSDWTVLSILLMGSVKIFIQRCPRDSLPDSYLGLSFVEQYVTQCSNIIVQYASSV